VLAASLDAGERTSTGEHWARVFRGGISRPTSRSLMIVQSHSKMPGTGNGTDSPADRPRCFQARTELGSASRTLARHRADPRVDGIGLGHDIEKACLYEETVLAHCRGCQPAHGRTVVRSAFFGVKGMTAKRPVRSWQFPHANRTRRDGTGFNSRHAQREACDGISSSARGREGWRLIETATMMRDIRRHAGAPALQRLLQRRPGNSSGYGRSYKVDRLTGPDGFRKDVGLFDRHGGDLRRGQQAVNTTSRLGRLTSTLADPFDQVRT